MGMGIAEQRPPSISGTSAEITHRAVYAGGKIIQKGLLDADIKGLGPEFDRRIMEIAELAGHGEDV